MEKRRKKMAFYSATLDEDGNESIRTYTSSRSSVMSPKKCLRTVRYVNSAVCIEKSYEDEESESEDSKSLVAIPNLDLSSNNDSYPSTDENEISYGQACEMTNIITRPDAAFNDWLEAKK